MVPLTGTLIRWQHWPPNSRRQKLACRVPPASAKDVRGRAPPPTRGARRTSSTRSCVTPEPEPRTPVSDDITLS
jgi:hypothetical protein